MNALGVTMERKKYGRRADSKTQTSISLRADLLEKARVAAEKDGRTFSNWVEQLIREMLGDEVSENTEKEELIKIFCGRYGYIAAGVGYQNPETATYEEEVELPPNLYKYKEKWIYAVRVVGDSMLPKYEDGQDVFILPQDTAENGQTVAVLLPDGSNVLKVYRRDEQSSWLESRNKEKYPEKIEKFQLRGVVVHP